MGFSPCAQAVPQSGTTLALSESPQAVPQSGTTPR
jgi:hypothetical protein